MRGSIVGRFVGARVTRVEDRRLLAGVGRYIDDVSVPGMLHAAFLRSPYPHAEIAAIDVNTARLLPGVHLVLTGDDLKTRTHPFFGVFNLSGFYQPTFWALAVDRVRHVGDPAAIVVADSRHLAEDACELIDVEYRPLAPIATVEHALDPDRELVWPKSKTNVHYRDSETFGDVDAAFAAADRVVVETFSQQRVSNQPMEARGIVAEFDPATGRLTVHSSTQSAHQLKWVIALLTGRRPIGDVLRQMVRQRAHTRTIFKGVADFLRASPETVAALKAMAPVMPRRTSPTWSGPRR